MNKIKPYLITAVVAVIAVALVRAVIKPMLPASIQAYL